MTEPTHTPEASHASPESRPAPEGLRARLAGRTDLAWVAVWATGLAAVWLWNAAFLNAPAFALLRQAFLNSMGAGIVAVAGTLVLGWGTAVTLDSLQRRDLKALHLLLTFLLNLLRSLPQMIGILIGYVVLTLLIEHDVVREAGLQVALTALLISLVTFTELVDVILERIEHYRRSDFYNALLVSGMREARIINVEILWTNSLAHILHKLIQTFGMAIFLQASIDFIVSVGLSTDVSLSNFPATLGNLLATIDSKQDILAVSVLFDDFSYITTLPFRHAQGLSTAFLIIFTLYCVYRLGNALVKRHHL
jgi:hypothetical protein